MGIRKMNMGIGWYVNPEKNRTFYLCEDHVRKHFQHVSPAGFIRKSPICEFCQLNLPFNERTNIPTLAELLIPED